MSAEDRLRELLEAQQVIAGELDLGEVLRRIVQTACRLTGARFGALGVLDASGPGLERFVHVGVTDATARRIGRPPEGRGLLGALIEEAQPIRVDRLADDTRTVGFPRGHPPMSSFLGVPIRVGERVYGNLYLTDAAAGRFSDDDEALMVSLAAMAGVAVENAHLFAEARARQDWLSASAEITRQTVAAVGGGTGALRTIVATVRRLAQADLVVLLVPAPDRSGLVVTAVAGEEEVLHRSAAASTQDETSQSVLASGQAVLVEESEGTADPEPSLANDLGVGPAMFVPLTGQDRVLGVLMSGRRPGDPHFTDADLDLATSFAHHAALALEVAEARRVHERVAVLEDRTRIAHGLHDHVLQELFGAGMLLESLRRGVPDPAHQRTLDKVVDRLDDAVKQIRTSIFNLRPHEGARASVRVAILDVAAEVAPDLGFEPRVRFEGPVDTVCDLPLHDDVVAVVREALGNVAEHAGARTATVRLQATGDRLEVEVSDDGHGMTGSPRSGLAHLEERATTHGGTLLLDTTPAGTGTVLRWSVPVGTGLPLGGGEPGASAGGLSA